MIIDDYDIPVFPISVMRVDFTTHSSQCFSDFTRAYMWLKGFCIGQAGHECKFGLSPVELDGRRNKRRLPNPFIVAL